MATITKLSFQISSTFDNTGLTRAQTSLKALGASIDDLSKKSISVPVNIDTKGLAQAKAQLDALGAMRETATVNVDTSKAHAGLVALMADTDNSRNKFTVLSGSADDVTRAMGGIGGSAGGAAGGMSGAAQSGSLLAGSMGNVYAVLGWVSLALMAIGPIAALTSAALLGGLGAGFVALGALALSQTSAVSNAFTGLKNSIMSDALQAAQGMEGPLLSGISQLETGLKGLTPAFTQAFSAAGTLIQPLVQSFLNFTGAVMPGVTAAIRAAGPVFQGLAQGAQALGAGVSQMFSGMAAGAAGAGSALKTFLGGIGQLLGTVGTAFGQMAAAGSRALSGLMTGLNALVSGAMQGFVGAVRAMDGTLGPFLAQLGQLAGTILSSLLPVLGQLLTALMAGLTPIMRALGPIIQTIGNALLQVAQAITPLIASVGVLVGQLLTALTPAINAIVGAIGNLLSAGLKALVPVVQQLTPIISSMASQFAAALGPAITAVANALVPLIPQIGNLAAQLLQMAAQILPQLAPYFPQIVQAFTNILTAIIPLIPQMIQFATQCLQLGAQLLPILIPLLVGVATVLGGALVTGLNAVVTIMNFFMSTTSNLGKIWGDVWGAVETVAKDVWGWLGTTWGSITSGISTAYSRYIAPIGKAWGDLWSGVESAAKNVWDWLTRTWDSVTSGLSSTAERVWNDIKSAVARVWKDIANAFVPPVNFVINTVWDGGIVKVWSDTVAKLPGMPDLPHVDPIGNFAKGGEVPMSPGAQRGKDSVLAMLMPDEHVLTVDQVRQLGGHSNIMANLKRLPHLAGGGSPGGGASGSGSNIKVSNGSPANPVTEGQGRTGGTQSTSPAPTGSAQARAQTQQQDNNAQGSNDNGDPITGALNFLTDLLTKGAAATLKAVADPLLGQIPGGQPFRDYLTKFIDGEIDAAGKQIDSLVKKTFSDGGIGGAGTIPTSEHKALIDLALAADGIPASQWPAWEAGMNTLISRESAWNASAVNNYDINAQNGTPSEGLAQVIAPTFAAYRNPSLPNDLLNPVSNIAASINYINATYGGIGNVQQANASAVPRGYWTGTGSAVSGWHKVGENGPEWVKFRGGEKVRAGLDGSGQAVTVNVTHVWPAGVSKDTVKFADETLQGDEVVRAFKAGVGKRPY